MKNAQASNNSIKGKRVSGQKDVSKAQSARVQAMGTGIRANLSCLSRSTSTHRQRFPPGTINLPRALQFALAQTITRREFTKSKFFTDVATQSHEGAGKDREWEIQAASGDTSKIESRSSEYIPFVNSRRSIQDKYKQTRRILQVP